MVQKSLHGCGVYRILNIANGKFYIGSSTDIAGRWYDHLWALRNGRHHSYRLQRDFNEFGEASFTAQIVELIKNPSDLLTAEQWWIDDTFCYGEDIGYNISPTAGNTLGKPCRPETRAKIGDGNRGRKWTREAIEKLKSTFATPEHQERMSNWHRSTETRSRISKTKGGSGYVLTLEDAQKAVTIYETGKFSIKQIASLFDVSYQQMRSALMGIGPKFGVEKQVYEPAAQGQRPEVIKKKIAKALVSVSDEVANDIRRLYAAGGVYQSELAERFGVNKVTVHRIIKAKHAYGSGDGIALKTTQFGTGCIRKRSAALLPLLEALDEEPLGSDPEG